MSWRGPAATPAYALILRSTGPPLRKLTFGAAARRVAVGGTVSDGVVAAFGFAEVGRGGIAGRGWPFRAFKDGAAVFWAVEPPLYACHGCSYPRCGKEWLFPVRGLVVDRAAGQTFQQLLDPRLVSLHDNGGTVPPSRSIRGVARFVLEPGWRRMAF